MSDEDSEHGAPNNNGNCETSQSRSAGLPEVLHNLLDNAAEEGLEEIVSWVDHGTAFKVHDKDAFVKKIMPKYFETVSYKSYQRSANLWNFETVRRGPRKGYTSNPFFRRGDRELCKRMKRVRIKGNGKKRGHDSTSRPGPRESQPRESDPSHQNQQQQQQQQHNQQQLQQLQMLNTLLSGNNPSVGTGGSNGNLLNSLMGNLQQEPPPQAQNQGQDAMNALLLLLGNVLQGNQGQMPSNDAGLSSPLQGNNTNAGSFATALQTAMQQSQQLAAGRNQTNMLVNQTLFPTEQGNAIAALSNLLGQQEHAPTPQPSMSTLLGSLLAKQPTQQGNGAPMYMNSNSNENSLANVLNLLASNSSSNQGLHAQTAIPAYQQLQRNDVQQQLQLLNSTNNENSLATMLNALASSSNSNQGLNAQTAMPAFQQLLANGSGVQQQLQQQQQQQLQQQQQQILSATLKQAGAPQSTMKNEPQEAMMMSTLQQVLANGNSVQQLQQQQQHDLQQQQQMFLATFKQAGSKPM